MMSAIQTFLFVVVGSSILEIEGTFWQHWFILFTASCFANLLGLNISSAFNSAVTIYILIPLLLIPQLILSGVVVKFDKLNPTIGNTATVPFVGDLMASRWAFEAAMVTQFKENEFEKQYYHFDKIMATADFKKVYLIPEIETRLQYCLNNYTSTDPEIRERVVKDLGLVANELGREVRQMKRHVPALQDLTPQKFSLNTYNDLSAFLQELKKFYVKVYNGADERKEKMIAAQTRGKGNQDFTLYREKYHNEAISELVKNVSETHRIIEQDGKLVQKIYPIYKDPDPDHPIDFDAQFYMPAKHFLKMDVDTFLFNTGVIWSMTIVLALLLYVDALRRIIDGFGNLSNPLHRRK
jgi:hypothetical protein